MKRIFSTLKEKWPEYLLEILVITIGILGAFILNNWNENRKLENSSEVYLEVLIDEMKTDLAELKSLNENMQSNLNAAQTILNQFKIITPLDSNTSNYLTSLVLEYNFSPNSTGFEALESTGGLSLLANDVQQKIREYYALTEKIKAREDISNSFIRSKYEVLIFNKYAHMWSSANRFSYVQDVYQDDPRPASPIDGQMFLADKQLEVLVFARQFQSQSQKSLYEEGVASLNDILVQLAKHDF